MAAREYQGCLEGWGWGKQPDYRLRVLNKQSKLGLPAPETKLAAETQVANIVLSALEASPEEQYLSIIYCYIVLCDCLS